MQKKIIAQMEKAYSLAAFKFQGKDHVLAATEKQGPCHIFDLQGQLVDTVWDFEPGGVMTMHEVPGSSNQFLATQKFYSPNDSASAQIVIATYTDSWEVKVLVDLPFVHRFDIISRGSRHYLVAFTLKSGHSYKEDWTQPGKIFYAELPEDLSQFNQDNQLEMKVLKEGLGHNHGYTVYQEGGQDYGLVSTDEGVFSLAVPAEAGGDFEIKQLISGRASDAILIDLDGDGLDELIVYSPFHGDDLTIYKQKAGKFEEYLKWPEKLEFLHAIYPLNLAGKKAVLVGNRRAKQELFALYWKDGAYQKKMIDQGEGPANVYAQNLGDLALVFAANRESDNLALYTLDQSFWL